MSNGLIESPGWTEPDPEDARIEALVDELSRADGPADLAGGWPEELWGLLARAGVTRWSLPREFGGEATPRPLLVQRYARLAEGSLTAVFILSQHDAAVRRLAAAPESLPGRTWLEAIGQGRAFATVGISQLTTSRRLGAQALVAAEAAPGVFRLDGAMPWVTGALRADVFVTGALLEDDRQILLALPADRPGVSVRPPFELGALQASCTAEVLLRDVAIDRSDLLAGPTRELGTQQGAVGTAGLETSALALGQARAALVALARLDSQALDLAEPLEQLCASWREAWGGLISCARGEADPSAAGRIRAQANGLVLRCTQAYLAARKGSGFLRTEPAQRWARQALFFLVWSCPTPLARAAIRDLAGLCPS